MAMSVFTFPVSYWAIHLECWQCLTYFPALCDNIVHDLCLRVCGWSCTLYDGPLCLREWLFLVMRALNLVVWVCTQGDCRRCIFMLYCVQDHRGVIVLIHVTKWHWFPHVCNMHQHALHFTRVCGVLSQATKNKTYNPKNICNSASKDRSHEEYLA